jgi:hypothetical protein
MGEPKMLKSFFEALSELLDPDADPHMGDDSHGIAENYYPDEVQ